MEIGVVNAYRRVRYNFFKWRYELGFLNKVVLAIGFACFTGLSAQVRFYLPWTPVPVTGQTFAVLLGAILIGKYWGGFSQIMYVGIGASGMPWFAGWRGGLGVIAGPTGGYLIGFIVAAFFLGHFVDRYIRSRCFFSMLALMLFTNFIIIYGLGLLHLHMWLSFVKGSAVSFWDLLLMGAAPFVAGDLTKVVAAAALAKWITPKEAYNGECDVEKWKNWRLP